tara:strand:- start:50 stop:394 length:345 start_codon:yes stop_codon:yes gene_type:complete
MVHKNYKWNISKEEGLNIVDNKIKEILLERNGRIEISELNFAIQNRTKEIMITNNKKKKNLINFIKVVLGGLRHHIENSPDIYLLSNEDNRLYIELSIIDSVMLNDWVFINEDD